jgi:hypothetical protein
MKQGWKPVIHYLIIHPVQDYNFLVKSCNKSPIHKNEKEGGATFLVTPWREFISSKRSGK